MSLKSAPRLYLVLGHQSVSGNMASMCNCGECGKLIKNLCFKQPSGTVLKRHVISAHKNSNFMMVVVEVL